MQPEISNAIQTLNDMADVEEILVEFERTAIDEQNQLLRLEQLLDLNRWYRNRFGVLFESRHDLRQSLKLEVHEKSRSPSFVIDLDDFENERGENSETRTLLSTIAATARDNLYRKMC